MWPFGSRKKESHRKELVRSSIGIGPIAFPPAPANDGKCFCYFKSRAFFNTIWQLSYPWHTDFKWVLRNLVMSLTQVMRINIKQWRSSRSTRAGSLLGKPEDETLHSSTIKGDTMRQKVISVAVAVCLLTLSAAATSFAQLPGTTMRASIPFDFSVRGKTFPAGEYEVKRVFDTPDLLMISNVARHEHEHAAFNTEPTAVKRLLTRGEFVFHRYGDRYFLAEVRTANDQTRHELTPSRQERDARREMASMGQQAEPETVAVAVY